MRLYLKLFAIIAIFIASSYWLGSGRLGRAVFVLRVAYVCSFGSPSDYTNLLDETFEWRAREDGNLHLYYADKRARELLAERRATAIRLGIQLSDEDIEHLGQECMREAIAQTDLIAPPRSAPEKVQAAAR